MWTILKYVVDNPDTENHELSDRFNEIPENIGFENSLENIKNEIDKNAENYIISLHYLEFPIIIHFGFQKFKDSEHLKILHDYLEPVKEVRKILLMDKADYIQGFYFLRKQINIQKDILNSLDQNTFDKKSSESGLEPYIINDLRTIWKNKRLEQLQKALAHHVDKYFEPKKEHPLYQTFLKYLEDIYKRGVDRFKTFICIGSTFIGKSIFFSKFIVPEEYYIYHSNFLEYSKMPNQPNKIFRILDDINWDEVTSTELKSLMNRNISSVNIKYGYEYIFPLIPIIIMNGEDYKIFRNKYSDIWEFIEKNAVIYPPQKGKIIKEETIPLFSDKELSLDKPDEHYLFNNIIHIRELKRCNLNNMNEWIKNELNTKESWKYDTYKYIQIPNKEDIKIPNPELNKKTILKQYEEYILNKKIKEMENKEGENKEEKKPKEPWYKKYKINKNKKSTFKSKFKDLESLSDEDSGDYRDNYSYNDYDDDSDDDNDMSDDSGDNSDDSSDNDIDYKKGFIQI